MRAHTFSKVVGVQIGITDQQLQCEQFCLIYRVCRCPVLLKVVVFFNLAVHLTGIFIRFYYTCYVCLWFRYKICNRFFDNFYLSKCWKFSSIFGHIKSFVILMMEKIIFFLFSAVTYINKIVFF